MRMRFLTAKMAPCLLVPALVTFSGCGGDSAPAPQAQANSQGDTTTPAEPADPRAPDEVVGAFLQAVRTGDDKQAEQLLTPLAKERTSQHDLVVAPPGSETASFKITGHELAGEDAAHVSSEWTDVGDDGQPHTDTIVWILRHEPHGWRIAGMGTKLFEDEPPLFLNFEDPEDMIRKQQLAEQEIRRREQLASGQAGDAGPDADVSDRDGAGDRSRVVSGEASDAKAAAVARRAAPRRQEENQLRREKSAAGAAVDRPTRPAGVRRRSATGE